MLFKQRFHAGILDGSVTLTFRAWSRPQARAGGRQRFGTYDGTREASGFLEIQGVDLVPVSSITTAQARKAGFEDAASLVEKLGRASRRRLRADSKVYRVSFRYEAGVDERAELARDDELSEEDVASIAVKLRRMDERSPRGPWTLETLRLIERRPRMVASRLAEEAGCERLAFKADVRKLKRLGLTISHEVGYEVSPRGRAWLGRRGR
jgi:hypothetical protein